ncbi:VP3 [Reovirus GCRV104]|nr:VP3 [Reovirus GCRV104]
MTSRQARSRNLDTAESRAIDVAPDTQNVPSNAATNQSDTNTSVTSSPGGAQYEHQNDRRDGAAGIVSGSNIGSTAAIATSANVDPDGDRVTTAMEASAKIATPASHVVNVAEVTKADVQSKQYERFVCTQCSHHFDSMVQLSLHMAQYHGLVDAGTLTSAQINQSILAFIKAWDGDEILTAQTPELYLQAYQTIMKQRAPLLVALDEGLSTSFMLSPIISEVILQDVTALQWYDSKFYDIPRTFPTGAVNRIVLDTHWASIRHNARPIDLALPPPTEASVDIFRNVLSKQVTEAFQFNPAVLRANVTLMALRFVLANTYMNASTTFAMDTTAFSNSRQLRVLPEKTDTLGVVMYPTRTVVANANQISDFLRGADRNRLGRVSRAQIISGALSAWNDVLELADTLTVSIRDAYTEWLRSMHIEPANIVIAINEMTHGLLSVSAPRVVTELRLMPWVAPSAAKRLQAAMDMLSISNSPSVIDPILASVADVLRNISVLKINPTLIADRMRSVNEESTQSMSPVGVMLELLRPPAMNVNGFWTAIAAWAYNAVCTTILSDDSYPVMGQTFLDTKAMWKAMICALSLPMTTDPNAPCKCFMLMANLIATEEPFDTQVPGRTHTTPASMFNHPSAWPPAFVQPVMLRQAGLATLFSWANLIHRHWPNPSEIRYGCSRFMGSANIFVPDDVLLLPLPNQPIQQFTIFNTYTSAMSNWISEVLNFFTRLLNNNVLRVVQNPRNVASMKYVLANLRAISTTTPVCLERQIPTELATIMGAAAVPPMQVPFARTDQQRVITEVGVVRHDPLLVNEMTNAQTATSEFVGVVVPVSASAIAVALLSGQTDPELIVTQHYAAAFAPLYTNDHLFTANQRAVVLSEAMAIAQRVVGECTDSQLPVPNILRDLRQYFVNAGAAAELFSAINSLFRRTFGIDGPLLEPLYETGDPRTTAIMVTYDRYDGNNRRVNVNPNAAFAGEQLSLVEEVILSEPNLFNIATGDIILTRVQGTQGWSGLAPMPNYIFDATMPDVYVIGEHSQFVYGLNGIAPTLMDEQDIARSLDSRWVISIQKLQTIAAQFIQHLWPRIAAGTAHVRVQMDYYPMVLTYYKPASSFSAVDMTLEWLRGITPTGVPPVPFISPEPSGLDVVAQVSYHFIISTEANEGSLFSTTPEYPRTRYGPTALMDPDRWRMMMNNAPAEPNTLLPNKVELYTQLRRYNYTFPSLSGVVTMAPT